MPVTVKKQGNMFRVVEADTGKLVKNDAGTPVDGSGHLSEQEAEAQARTINANQ